MGYGYSNPGMQTNDKFGNNGETIIELPSWKHFSASSLGFLYYIYIYMIDLVYVPWSKRGWTIRLYQGDEIEIYQYIWVKYNDLTATEPWESWLIREIIPKWH